MGWLITAPVWLQTALILLVGVPLAGVGAWALGWLVDQLFRILGSFSDTAFNSEAARLSDHG